MGCAPCKPISCRSVRVRVFDRFGVRVVCASVVVLAARAVHPVDIVRLVNVRDRVCRVWWCRGWSGRRSLLGGGDTFSSPPPSPPRGGGLSWGGPDPPPEVAGSPGGSRPPPPEGGLSWGVRASEARTAIQRSRDRHKTAAARQNDCTKWHWPELVPAERALLAGTSRLAFRTKMTHKMALA